MLQDHEEHAEPAPHGGQAESEGQAESDSYCGSVSETAEGQTDGEASRGSTPGLPEHAADPETDALPTEAHRGTEDLTPRAFHRPPTSAPRWSPSHSRRSST